MWIISLTMMGPSFKANLSVSISAYFNQMYVFSDVDHQTSDIILTFSSNSWQKENKSPYQTFSLSSE